MTDDLPLIPPEISTRHVDPQFCRWGNGFAVVGPEQHVPENEVVVVTVRWTGRRHVTVGRHVAARVVHHRDGSYTRQVQGEATRYVVAEIRNDDREAGP